MNRFAIAARGVVVFGVVLFASADVKHSMCAEGVFAAEVAADNASAEKPLMPRESWDSCFLQGGRIGYAHPVVRRGAVDGRPPLATENTIRLSLKRAGFPAEQEMRTAGVETPEGQLISFACDMKLGPAPIRIAGTVRGDKLEIETTAAGGAVSRRSAIPWSADYGGPFAAEQSLLRRPMPPGQKRTVKSLMPQLDQVEVADVELAAKDFEPVALQNGTYQLLRIDTVTRFPGGQTIEGSMWTDRTGDALKTHLRAMNMETYRTTRADALEKTDAVGPDLFSSLMVRLDRPLVNPHQTRRVRYRVHLDGGDPAGVFPTGATQALRSLDAETAELTVWAIRPGRKDGNPDAPADPPADDDRRPNTFIQSDDPIIQAEAEKAAGDAKDPWATACALERYVHREIERKDYTQAFATASEVAKTRQGDCTEHAVFLAALARARGIPARVAVGLVYAEGEQAFLYHMWTEVYVEGRWIPLDGTLARGGIGAAHLKIAESSLKSAFGAFLQVMQAAGRLRIEVIDREDGM